MRSRNPGVRCARVVAAAVALAAGGAALGQDSTDETRVSVLLREQSGESSPDGEIQGRFTLDMTVIGAPVRGVRSMGLRIGDLQIDVPVRGGRFRGLVPGAPGRLRGGVVVSGTTLHASFNGTMRDGEGSVFGRRLVTAARHASYRNGAIHQLEDAALTLDGREVPVAVGVCGRSALRSQGELSTEERTYRVVSTAAGLSAASRGRPIVQLLPAFPGDVWNGRVRGHVLTVGLVPSVSVAAASTTFTTISPIDSEALDLGGGSSAGEGVRSLPVGSDVAWHVRFDSAAPTPDGTQTVAVRAETRTTRVAGVERTADVDDYVPAQAIDAREQVLEIRAGGVLWAWGRNDDGQVGDGTRKSRSRPVELFSPLGVVAVTAAPRFSAAVDRAGTLWRWGDWSPEGTSVAGASSPDPVAVSAPTRVVSAAAGSDHLVILDASGDVRTVGANAEGQLGDGSRRNRLSSPVVVDGLPEIRAVAAAPGVSVALDLRGDVWVWGRDVLGAGEDALVPVKVHGLPPASAVSAGGEIVVLAQNGTVWTLATGGTIGPTATAGDSGLVPTQMSFLYGVTAVDAGASHSLALRSDGTVWAWGTNEDGELGDGTSTSSATPVRVRELTNATLISAGTHLSIAVLGDGSVRAWGRYTGHPGPVGWRESGDGVYPQLLDR